MYENVMFRAPVSRKRHSKLNDDAGQPAKNCALPVCPICAAVLTFNHLSVAEKSGLAPVKDTFRSCLQFARLTIMCLNDVTELAC